MYAPIVCQPFYPATRQKSFDFSDLERSALHQMVISHAPFSRTNRRIYPRYGLRGFFTKETLDTIMGEFFPQSIYLLSFHLTLFPAYFSRASPRAQKYRCCIRFLNNIALSSIRLPFSL